jgi:hypothetical protein
MSTPPSRVDLRSPDLTRVLDPGAKDAFWSVVQDCLVEFHKMDPSRAQTAAMGLRARIESPPGGINGDMIYHEEPFYVACDLAGMHDTSSKDRLLSKNRSKYDSILDLKKW